jgi:hypothetical protein
MVHMRTSDRTRRPQVPADGFADIGVTARLLDKSTGDWKHTEGVIIKQAMGEEK